MVNDERRVQTQAKHRILEDYLPVWYSIINGGLSRNARRAESAGRPFHSRLLYIDGFSFKGRYTRNQGDTLRNRQGEGPIWGSPIIGVRAMDDAREHAKQRFQFRIETASILVEKDRDHFAALIQNLEQAGIDRERIIINPQAVRPKDGEVIVLHADFLDCFQETKACLEEQYTKGFVLLDPYGMKGIPYDMVKEFVGLSHTDVMINWPFLDIQRKQGRLDRGDERIVAGDHAVLANIDSMFGCEGWRKCCGEEPTVSLPEVVTGDLETCLANLYRSQVQAADPAVTVKQVPLMFSKSARTMYYLFLTTHDPCGALVLNQVLDSAKLWELGVRWHLRQDRYVRLKEQAGQPSLFDLHPLVRAAPVPPERTVDIQHLGRDIHSEWLGRIPTRKDIYRSQANTSVYQGEIDRALTWLKNHGMVEFTGTKITEPVRFIRIGSGI